MKILLTIHDDVDRNLAAQVYQSASGKFSVKLVDIETDQTRFSWHQFASFREAREWANEAVTQLPAQPVPRDTAALLTIVLMVLALIPVTLWLLA